LAFLIPKPPTVQARAQVEAQTALNFGLADLVVLDTAQPSLPARARPASELRLLDGARLGIYGRVLVAVLSSDWR